MFSYFVKIEFILTNILKLKIADLLFEIEEKYIMIFKQRSILNSNILYN